MKLIVFNNHWQEPAITEKHAYAQVSAAAPSIPNVTYIAFPWATLIDAIERNVPLADQLRASLTCLLPEKPRSDFVVTVCQHIKYEKYLSLFRSVGITDIYASHAQIRTSLQCSVRIWPFQLYPVQRPYIDVTTKENYSDEYCERDILFSYMGAHSNKYLSDARDLINRHLTDCPDALIIKREAWHYDRQVYTKQILGQETSEETMEHERRREDEYKQVMRRSTFALCPSGTGPNSIRFWEAIEFGTIPVLLSDLMTLPGDRKDWDDAIVRVPETADAISDIPRLLRLEVNNHLQMINRRNALKRVRNKFGVENTVQHLIERLTAQAALLESVRRTSVRQHVFFIDLSRIEVQHHTAQLRHACNHLALLHWNHAIFVLGGDAFLPTPAGVTVLNSTLRPYDVLDVSLEFLTVFDIERLTVNLARRFHQIVFAPASELINKSEAVQTDVAERILKRFGNYDVTLITSVFKGAPYIPAFLRSASNYIDKSRVEHILIIANSPSDDLLSVALEPTSAEVNLAVVNLPADPGLYEVWNTGVTLSSGRFVGNSNLDDFRSPTQLSTLLSLLQANQDAAIASTALRVSSECIENWESRVDETRWYANLKAGLFDVEGLYRINSDGSIAPHNVPHCAPLWRRDLHFVYGYFDEKRFGPSADWEFWLRCAGAGVRLVHTPSVETIYYKNTDTYWRRSKVTKELEGAIVAFHFHQGRLLHRFDGSQSSLLLQVIVNHCRRSDPISTLAACARVAKTSVAKGTSTFHVLSTALRAVLKLQADDLIPILGQHYRTERSLPTTIIAALGHWVEWRLARRKTDEGQFPDCLTIVKSLLEALYGQYRSPEALLVLSVIAKLTEADNEANTLYQAAKSAMPPLAFDYAVTQLLPTANQLEIAAAIQSSEFSPADFEEFSRAKRIFVFPDYRRGNAYQQLLYESLEIDSSRLIYIDEIQSLEVSATGPTDILHIHWINVITSGVHEPEEKRAYHQFLESVKALRTRGTVVAWTIHNVQNHDASNLTEELTFRRELALNVDRIYVHHPAIPRHFLAWLPVEAQKNVEYYEHGLYPVSNTALTAEISERMMLGLPQDAIVAATIGQIRPYKEVFRLLPALRELLNAYPRLRVVIAGRISCSKTALALKESSHPRLHVIDEYLSTERLNALHRTADFIFLSYRKILTSGGLFAALSHKVPVIAPRLGTLPFYVRAGRNGWLYDDDKSFRVAFESAVSWIEARSLDADIQPLFSTMPEWPTRS